MSKERARRRAERVAVAARQRAVRERRGRRRAAVRRLRRLLLPRLPDRRTGKLYARRTRAERAGIAIVAGFGALLVWLLVEPLPVRIGITALLAVAAPALVVITLDRRS